MKYNSVKRFTALLMACLMVFGMLPTGALADQAVSDNSISPYLMTRSATPSNNLMNFIKSANITGLDANGTMIKGQEFSIELSFKENTSYQFAENGDLYYQLPKNLYYPPIAPETTVTLDTGTDKYTIKVAQSIDNDGVYHIHLDNGSEAAKKFIQATTGTFMIGIKAQYTGDGNQVDLDFGGGIKKDYPIGTSGMTVSKQLSYIGDYDKDKKGYTFNYKITIKPTGTQTNVVIEDILSGDMVTNYGLKYNGDIKVNSDETKIIENNPNDNDTGFTIKLDKVEKDTELTYTAFLPWKEDLEGTKFSASNSGATNTVKAKSDQTTTEVGGSATLENTELKPSTKISKTKSVDEEKRYNAKGEVDPNGDYRKVSWQIEVNSEQLICLHGLTLEDELSNESGVSMIYCGSGITDNNTLVPWEKLFSKTDTSFVYAFMDKEGERVAHTITYDTLIDTSKYEKTQDIKFKNKATITNGDDPDPDPIPGGGPSESTADVPGIKDTLGMGIKKSGTYVPATDTTGSYIAWTIELDVPWSANSVVIEEKTPEGNNVYDEIDKQSINIKTLGPNESYEIKYLGTWAGEGKYEITLSLQPNLEQDQDTKRNITITLNTIYNKTNTNVERVNTVKATAYRDGVSGDPVDTTAKVDLSKLLSIKKKYGDPWGNTGNALKWDDKGLPMFMYTVTLNNIPKTQTNITLTETFNKNIFEIANVEASIWPDNFTGWYKPYESLSVSDSIIQINGLNEQYFDWEDTHSSPFDALYIQYYLKVQDGKLGDLIDEALKCEGLTYPIQNSVKANLPVESAADNTATWKFKGLDKRSLVSPSQANGYQVKYQIKINEDKLNLSDGDLTIVDTMTNLRLVDIPHMKVVDRDGKESESAANYDIDGDVITFTVKDECYVEITYTAQVIGSGMTVYDNIADLRGYVIDNDNKAEVDMNSYSEGDAKTPTVYVYKIDEFNNKQIDEVVYFNLQQRQGGGDWETINLPGYTNNMIPSNSKNPIDYHGYYAFDAVDGEGNETAHYEYRLVEVDAPKGYIKGEPYEFRFYIDPQRLANDKNGYAINGVVNVSIYNRPLSFSIRKQGEDGNYLKGAKLQLLKVNADNSEELKLEWVSGLKDKIFPLKNYEEGTYILREVEAPNTTYEKFDDIKFTVEKVVEDSQTSSTPKVYVDINVTSGNSAVVSFDGGVLVVKNRKEGQGSDLASITLKKVDSTYAQALTGAEFTLAGPGANDTRTCEITQATGLTIDNLTPGNYTLTETQAPAGYKMTSAKFTFVVSDKGVVSQSGQPDSNSPYTFEAKSGDTPAIITLKNEKTQITVKKEDNNGHALDGAELAIYDPDNTPGPYANWTSDGVAGYTVSGLKYEKTYTLTESKAPDGYALNSNSYCVFKLKDDNTIEILECDTSFFTSQGSNITVKNAPSNEKVKLSGTKVWENEKGSHPIQIQVKIKANGVYLNSGAPYTLTLKDNKWETEEFDKYTYDDTNGKATPIVYEVEEVTVDGYKPGVVTHVQKTDESGTATGEVEPYQFTITNTPTNFTVLKKAESENGSALEGAEFELQKNDAPKTVVSTQTTNDDGRIVFTHLTLGQEYILHEKTAPRGYQTAADVTIKLVWVEAKGDTPAHAQLQKKNDDEWENVTDNTLTIVDLSWSGITTSISGTKTWNDNNNQDGKRPASITINLFQNGKKIDSKTVTAADEWKWTFSRLRKHDDQGNAYTYTITENQVEGYGSDVKGYNVTNSHTPEKTEVSGSKTWDDNNNQDGKRPVSIKINLYANGEYVDSRTVTEADDWSWKFDGLDKYASGNLINYTITEDTVSGYTSTVNGYDVENSHTPATTSRSVTKVWNDANNQNGMRPSSIKVQLYAETQHPLIKTYTSMVSVSGTKYKFGAEVELSESNGWSHRWNDLPEYLEGQKVTYTCGEVGTVNEYTTACSEENGNFTITNTYTPGKTSVSVTKIWDDQNNKDGLRPTEVEVELLANGKSINKTVKLNAANNWTHTWTDLDEKEAGEFIEYTCRENTTVTGYTTAYSTDTFNITNTHTVTPVEVFGSKTWVDDETADNTRPESITIKLMKTVDGIESVADTKVVEDKDGWAWSFGNLPQYENGKKITYSIEEETVANYTSNVRGYNVTNTLNPGTVELNITKKWEDNNNQDNLRPQSITFTVYANGEKVSDHTITPVNGTWNSVKVENLEKYDKDGKKIVYTVKETAVTGYNSDVESTDSYSFTITNTHTPGTIEVAGKKNWVGDTEDDRPENITIRLWADGTEKEAKTVTAKDGWKWSFTNLPENVNGKAIVYTITEDAVPGYISKVDGYNVTNTITSVKISKVDVTSKKELPGAHIQILDKDKNVITEWDSTDKPHDVTGLETGKEYILRETVAPDGYTIATDTHFELNSKGEVDVSKTNTPIREDGVLLVEDTMTSVQISKVEVTKNEELPGAHIQILDKDKNVITEWDSTDKPHEVTGLKTGETYTLKETVAPNGYTIASETTFTLDEKGKIDKSKTTTKVDGDVLLIEDAKTSVKISKVDIANGEELEGAEIQIIDSKGNVVDSWTSTKEPHEVIGLKTGETYTLKETVAPEGYEITTDTTFTLDEKGKIDESKTTTSVSEEGVLLVEDDKTSVKISKVDIADGEELEGAEIQIIDSKGDVVDSWISTKEPHEVTGLKTGETYTLKETVAPEGYEITTDTTFTLDEKGEIDKSKTTTKVDGDVLLIEDAKTSVKISKVDIADGEELEGAKIEIIDSKGDVVDSWISTKEPHEVTGLKTGETYTLKETVAPEGYDITTDTTFTLDEKGEIDKTKTTTKVSEEGVLLVEDSKKEEKPTPTPTATPTVTPTEEPTPTPTVPVQRYMNIRGRKVWDDMDNYDGIRPESVEITLQRRSTGRAYETVETITVTGDGDEWAFIFEHMPEFDERFERYQYRVVETPVEGYTANVNGYTITNVHAAVTPTPVPTPEPTPTPTPTPEPTPTPLPERFYNEMPPRAVTIRYVDGEWIYIDDFGVPLGLVGQTGDDDNLAAVFAGMAVLLMMAGALAFVIVRKEKRKQT